ncbi:hypothetical protein [Faecalibaculum rodentium]|uniref:hypothetical protein n=1 Tax=Faecalibaculum rodentium TaxID=1702221 RepID=UPI00272F0B2C|nr:hypothetical protein [Faecalibaculum rodentium]
MPRFHDKTRWKKRSRMILSRDNYLDMVALRFFGIRQEADMVHHIYPVEDYPEFAYAEWNLISTSRKTHNRLHYADGSLTPLGQTLLDSVTPGQTWRKQ